jgi:predicted MFS family arabinose efflux permease
MPSFSRWAGIPLHRAAGLKEAIDGIMSVAGPVAGGIIIALYGTTKAWFGAAALCLVIVCIAVFFYQKRRPRRKSNTTTYANAWQNMRGDKFLLLVILFTLPLFILGESWELLILPAYVHTNNYTSVFLGVLEAAFGLGAFIGAIYFTAAAKRVKFFTLLIVNYLAYTLSIVVLICALPAAVVVAATFISGLPFGAFGAMVTTILLSRANESTRGKTLGIFAASTAFTESLCILIIGFMLQNKGFYNTLLSAACIFTALIFISLFTRRFETAPTISEDDKNNPSTGLLP